MRKLCVGLIILMFAFVAISCNPSVQKQINEDKAQLKERAEMLWKAYKEQDYETVYSLMPPEVQASQNKMQLAGMSSTVFHTINYHIDAIDIDPDGEHATVIVTNSFFAPPIPQPRVVTGQNTPWIKIDGVWFPEIKKQEDVTTISGVVFD